VSEGLRNTTEKGTIAVRVRVRVYNTTEKGNHCSEGESEGLRNEAEKGRIVVRVKVRV